MTTVLFVSHSAELNGAELWLLATLRGLDRGAWRPILAVPRPGPLAEAARAAGVETHVVAMKWSYVEPARLWRQPLAALLNIRAVGRLARIVRDEGAGLVVTNSAAVASGARAARRAGVPHVWAVHEVLAGPAPFLRSLRGARALRRFIAASSARVIVNSRATAAAFPDASRTVVVPNGMALAARPGAGRLESLRAELGLPADGFAAVIVGKIYAGKGQREAVEAAALLAPRRPGFRLLVVGGTADERYARSLRDLVSDNGLAERVLFLGYRPDLADILGLARAVVVASTVESLGRAALEGMAAGVPVLAIGAGGLAEIVRPGVNGFLLPSRAPEEIARGLEFLMDHPAEAAAAVEGGYRTVREDYSLERQIAGVDRALRQALGAA